VADVNNGDSDGPLLLFVGTLNGRKWRQANKALDWVVNCACYRVLFGCTRATLWLQMSELSEVEQTCTCGCPIEQ
jgi:hypothetical protein